MPFRRFATWTPANLVCAIDCGGFQSIFDFNFLLVYSSPAIIDSDTVCHTTKAFLFASSMVSHLPSTSRFLHGFFYRLPAVERSLNRVSPNSPSKKCPSNRVSRPSSCGSGDLIRFRLSVNWTSFQCSKTVVFSHYKLFGATIENNSLQLLTENLHTSPLS